MGITNLEIHTGHTKKIRAQTTAPTTPTPTTGDVYYDTSAGLKALAIYRVNGWIYISTKN